MKKENQIQKYNICNVTQINFGHVGIYNVVDIAVAVVVVVVFIVDTSTVALVLVAAAAFLFVFCRDYIPHT